MLWNLLAYFCSVVFRFICVRVGGSRFLLMCWFLVRVCCSIWCCFLGVLFLASCNCRVYRVLFRLLWRFVVIFLCFCFCLENRACIVVSFFVFWVCLSFCWCFIFSLSWVILCFWRIVLVVSSVFNMFIVSKVMIYFCWVRCCDWIRFLFFVSVNCFFFLVVW